MHALLHEGESAARPARQGESRELLAVLTSAFANDPPTRWLFPDELRYRRLFPAFAQALGGAAMACGTALIADRAAGAALWLPPDVASDENAILRLVETGVADEQKQDAFAVFDEMGRLHPHEPHWYLPLIGVTPERQGLGYGAALLQYGLALCDRDDMPAYLEATTSRSIPLYQRHGFAVVGEIAIGGCPLIVPMLRPRRGAVARG